ncbi:MAG: hypothetical protein RMM58_07370 [Chloroflexota bacterium]|nr:hypothetical protein [Dehalococcoidia bacterium]MDW8253679.1 hypothetical protein [Chloroflexota bacterium]
MISVAAIAAPGDDEQRAMPSPKQRNALLLAQLIQRELDRVKEEDESEAERCHDLEQLVVGTRLKPAQAEQKSVTEKKQQKGEQRSVDTPDARATPVKMRAATPDDTLGRELPSLRPAIVGKSGGGVNSASINLDSRFILVTILFRGRFKCDFRSRVAAWSALRLRRSSEA